MTVEQILQSLEEIREKLNLIRGSHTYQTLVAHPEYIVEDFSLTDSVQGIEEALEAIPYVCEFEALKLKDSCCLCQPVVPKVREFLES